MIANSPELPMSPLAKAFQFRPYQSQCVADTHSSLIDFDRSLVVAATGSGKAVIMAKLAGDCVQKRGAFCVSEPRVLILVNREELLIQAARQVEKVTGIYAAIERAQDHGSLDSPIIVATIQTLQRRLDKYPSNHFGLVIVDEAHLFAAPKIVEVLDQFCYPEGAKLIGFTATPGTKGKRALSKIYETIAFQKNLGELIQEKWLCNVKVQTVPIKIDLSAVRSKAGDFMDEDLDGVVTPYFVRMAEEMKKHPGRKWLCFLPLIKTSEHFAETLRSHDVHCQHVDGKSENRRDILAQFKAGRFQALSNSLMVTTGYDEPSITGIVNLRPTKSRILLQQIIGRGTRLKPEDSIHQDLLILDPLWQAPELQELMSPAILFAATEEDEKELKKRLESGEEMDLFEEHTEVVKNRHDKLAAALKANESKMGKLLDFAALLTLGIEKNSLFEECVDYEPTMRWHSKKPTSGQLSALTKMGIDLRIVKDMGHASVLMAFCVDRIKRGICTFKQANALKRAGYKLDFNTLTIGEASKLIGQLYSR